ncbi:MAG TPA: hypothetical protein VG165_05040 [Solirubrobacteraceae bacterium]|nr:hypothetical protein [Solirubrobacteraceae bacterium]
MREPRRAAAEVGVRRRRARHRAGIEPGLSDLEVAAAQQRFGLSFPPDLRALLQHGLPTGRDLPNWRDPDADDYLRWALGKSGRAIEFDVLNNGVWFGRWGPRPETDARSAALAADEFRKVPVLVPVYANHYLPGDPPAAGNPVLSFWQIIDAVYRANDLADYLAAEFDAPRPAWTTPTDRRRTVPFWSAVIESSGSLHELADV